MLRIFAGALVIVAAFLPTANSDPPADVKLEVVKWPGLEKTLSGHKGKVVVIDLWADFCIPCKKEFPHFVEMHQKYAKDGLVCISLSVDDAEDKDRTIKFLKAQKATMANYLIDEPAETWQTKLNVTVPPNVIVIGKDGKRVKRFSSDVDGAFTYADVEKVVKPLLGK
jgi:thiol-disulfide isomerase/thioredoxin